MTQLSPKAAAQVMQRLDPAYKAPGSDDIEGAAGTPAARFAWLLSELEKRLPDPDPLSAELPEPRYLAQIDEALRLLEGMRCHLTGQGRHMERQELIDGIEKLIGPWKPMCDCGAKRRPQCPGQWEPMCDCGAKRRPQCPGQWEPGCDLGANEAHIRAAPAGPGVDLATGFRYVKNRNPVGSSPLPARITQEQYDNLTPFGRSMYREIKS